MPRVEFWEEGAQHWATVHESHPWKEIVKNLALWNEEHDGGWTLVREDLGWAIGVFIDDFASDIRLWRLIE